MGRIEDTFKRLQENREKALISFVTVGDPDLQGSKEIFFSMEKNGADIIELGIPFSDPMADGPIIQASSERALKNGVTLKAVLNLIKEIRKTSETPVILFGYFNPIFVYGTERFAQDAKDAGVDGVLVVDLPPEEADELKIFTDKVGIDIIFLLTPTSDKHRMTLIADKAEGFIYFVSLTGVTGVRSVQTNAVADYVARAKKFSHFPIGVGFGISTPEQAREVAMSADGVVVGSAIVKIIEAFGEDRPQLLQEVGGFVKALKQGILSINRN
jgi:tryptophan synthase alpha chain